MCGEACPNYSNISPQNLEKELNGEADFLQEGKHENLLQIDTMILMGDGQAFPVAYKLI